MHLPKCCLTVVTFLLVKVSGNLSDRQEESDLDQSDNSIPYWENILREFVFKTISPPPPANNALYRRLLEAPFYSGPISPPADRDSIILSRGDVFYLPNGRWILCQEGCTNCEVCTEQRNPTVKWTLRRLKRESSLRTVRYDLQLTIVPQVDESYHMKNLWPRNYVYVTTLNEREKKKFQEKSEDSLNPYSITGPDKILTPDEGTRIESNHVESTNSSHSSLNDNKENSKISRSTEVTSDAANSIFGPEFNLKNKIEEDTPDPTYLRRNIYGRRYRSRDKPSGRPGPLTLFQPPGLFNASDPIESDVDSTNPRVILGTDQLGRKHLVHVVPGDDKSVNGTGDSYVHDSVEMISSNNNNNHDVTNTYDDSSFKHPAYDKVVRKVLDSLNSHRLSIEKFFLTKEDDVDFKNKFYSDNVRSNELRKRDDSAYRFTTESYNEDTTDRERSSILKDRRDVVDPDNDDVDDYRDYEISNADDSGTEFNANVESKSMIGPDRFTKSLNDDNDEIVVTDEYENNFEKFMTQARRVYPSVNTNLTNFEKSRVTGFLDLAGRVMGYDHDNATDFLRDDKKFVY